MNIPLGRGAYELLIQNIFVKKGVKESQSLVDL
jgi:hypothetical protein